MQKYKKERKEIARFMRRLYNRGLTTTSGGNISLRVSDDTILITPSATDKGRMKWKEVGILSIIGENLTPDLKLSIESEMHLNIFKRNNEILSIVHAHPVFASSFTAMNAVINTSLTAEARVICGEPLLVPYAVMGSPELAEAVADCSTRSDVLLLENHGVLATGTSLLQAFDKLEVLENAARMTLIVEMMGKKKGLSLMRIRELERLFR
ncbi:MAG TPA: class II aldolase/adducin family protein [Bacteroidales bacterium]|jgi:L-fuculose-phosphate aldolase|nr:class II aldolase/adducin family protein [Bacteroidales bacterium]OQB64139.1 MAG: L-fuculose phosphate aldolase [Bacteroidetes bacterium ADurb.Bin145]NMD03065.1 class II aldolase/adducin family protein [Bacteroidales bacterium]HOU02783.1 class II aldolase/adducin family protein [Bacteroidales bacterium]HQG63116.1 class II aldolase/adducin family protein [Bacteroidales bacterium]